MLQNTQNFHIILQNFVKQNGVSFVSRPNTTFERIHFTDDKQSRRNSSSVCLVRFISPMIRRIFSLLSCNSTDQPRMAKGLLIDV